MTDAFEMSEYFPKEDTISGLNLTQRPKAFWIDHYNKKLARTSLDFIMRLFGKLLFSWRLRGGDGARIEASFPEVYWLLTSKAKTVALSLLLEEPNPEGSGVCVCVCAFPVVGNYTSRLLMWKGHLACIQFNKELWLVALCFTENCSCVSIDYAVPVSSDLSRCWLAG